MLSAQSVLAGPICGKKVNAILFDDLGSTVTLVTHRWAARSKIKGTPSTIYLRVVGLEKYEEVRTQLYTFAIVDKSGTLQVVSGYGIDSLTHIAPAPGLGYALSQFPEVQMEDIKRPEGEADILLGMDRVALHPESVSTKGGLRLMRSQFGTGWVVTGILPDMMGRGERHESYHILTDQNQLPVTATVCHVTTQMPNFFETEDLAYAPRRECRDCKECQSCKLAAENIMPEQSVHRSVGRGEYVSR